MVVTQRVRFGRIAFIGVSLALAGCSPAETGASPDALNEGEPDAAGIIEAPNVDTASLISDGRAIIENECAHCHAIGLDDDSPRADAPPLRVVLARYAPEALAEDFREHIHVGHPDMPDFNFSPLAADAVLAYLISIQTVSGLELEGENEEATTPD